MLWQKVCVCTVPIKERSQYFERVLTARDARAAQECSILGKAETQISETTRSGIVS